MTTYFRTRQFVQEVVKQLLDLVGEQLSDEAIVSILGFYSFLYKQQESVLAIILEWLINKRGKDFVEKIMVDNGIKDTLKVANLSIQEVFVKYKLYEK